MLHQRDPINFDFRVVALLTVMVTRPDLLREYRNGTYCKLLRLGFSRDLLDEFVFLFKQDEILQALETMQRLFRTAVAVGFYCDEDCPLFDWLSRYVASTAQLPQLLNPAGVEVGPRSLSEVAPCR